MASPTSLAQPPVVFPLCGPPVCVTIGKANENRCIRSVHDELRGATLMEQSSDATSPTQRFYLEPSLQHDGLLHVRCGATNKYWAAQQVLADDGGTEWFICAAADGPEEDLHKPSCTLFDFKPHRPNEWSDTVIRFFHPQQQKYAYMRIDRQNKAYLKLKRSDDLHGPLDVRFTFFRASRLSLEKELPRFVCFKGSNGRYLALKDDYLQFSSTDITDPGIVHETSTDEFGAVRISCKGSGRFWRLVSDGWIYAGPSDPYGNHTFFKVVNKGDNYISLQSINNGHVCKKLTADSKTDCLSACVDDGKIDKDALLQFEEPVRSREIYDVNYRAGEKNTSMNNEYANRTEVRVSNRTNLAHSAELYFETYERRESVWNVNLKLDAGIKTHLTASAPLGIFKVEGGIEGHLDLEGQYSWGKTELKENKYAQKEIFSVPPMKDVRCSVFSSKVVVDVPFSYMQKDTLHTGEKLPPRQMDDGIYRGMESSDTKIETK